MRGEDDNEMMRRPPDDSLSLLSALGFKSSNSRPLSSLSQHDFGEMCTPPVYDDQHITPSQFRFPYLMLLPKRGYSLDFYNEDF